MSEQPELFDARHSDQIEGGVPAPSTTTSLPSAQFCANGRQSKTRSTAPPTVENRLDSQPVLLVLPFPLVARVGKVRDVAAKMVATKSPRHAAAYQAQVTEALRVNLTGKRVPTELLAGELRQFWQAVDLELARLLNASRGPGGGKA